MNKDALEGLISVLDNWAAFFTLLVVIGVGGELAIHIMSSRANKKLIALQKGEALTQEAEIAQMKKDSASFDLEVQKAKEGTAEALARAAKAEENLGNAKKDAALALQKAADANRIAEEERLKRVQLEERMKDRSLTNSSILVNELSAFKGTEYMFTAVFADEESINLLKQVDAVLQSAGWKRQDSAGPAGVPTIGVSLGDGELHAPPSLITGIQISISSAESEETLRSKPLAELPAFMRAAILLYRSLSVSISPKQESPNRQFVNVTRGGLTSVQIDIGKKP
jgi:hypothetical protein